MGTTENESELIEAIKDWLNSENIQNAKRDDENIRKFLQGCKYNLQETKNKMTNFYTMRRNWTELFRGRDPFNKNIASLLDLGVSYPLPNKSPEGAVIFMIKAAANNPLIIPMIDVIKQNIMSVDLMMELDDDLTKHGVHVIIDMKGVCFYHGIQMTPKLIYKMVYLWQNCYPIKIKGIDFINCPGTINVILNIFKEFLTEKLKKRLRNHNTVNTLHDNIQPQLLPQEYGGFLGPEKQIFDKWKTKIQSFREWFLTDFTVL